MVNVGWVWCYVASSLGINVSKETVAASVFRATFLMCGHPCDPCI